MDPSNIAKFLEYDTDFSSKVDDDFPDPDFRISDRENDELDGILAFDTDSDCYENNQPDFLLPEINVIDETSDDEHTHRLRLMVKKESLIYRSGNGICQKKKKLKALDIFHCVRKLFHLD